MLTTQVWVVHDHPDVPGTGPAFGLTRAVVAPVPPAMAVPPPLVVSRALHEAPAHAAQTVYDVGPTRVGFPACRTS